MENLKRIVNESDGDDDVLTSKVRLIFKDQKLLDLWKNELLGQLSDGAWENSKGTDWLWKNSSAVLGDKNEIQVPYFSIIGRKNYSFFKELFEVIGDRMVVESGFISKEELKTACNTISNMIKEPIINSNIVIENQKQAEQEKVDKKEGLNIIINKYDIVEWNLAYDFCLGEFKLKNYKKYNNYKLHYSLQSKKYQLSIENKSLTNSFSIEEFPQVVKALEILDQVGNN